MWAKKKWIWCSALIILLLIILFLFSLPFLHLGLYVSVLDNPHVNARYSGWKDIQLDELRFKIPEDWHLTQDGADLTIVDSENHILALGEKRGHEDTFVENVIQRTISSAIESRTIETRDVMKWNRANCYKWNVKFSDGKSCTLITVSLMYHLQYSYYFVFFPLQEDEIIDIYNIAEAIAWSMTYVDDSPGFLEQKALRLR